MASPVANFESGLEAPVNPPEKAAPPQEITDDEQFARQALSTFLGGIEVVAVWARNPFKEYRGGQQIGGAMEAICRVRDGDEIGTRTIWLEGKNQPLDERTLTYLGWLANANWRDPQTPKFRRDYGGERGHYRIIHGGLTD